MADNYKRSISVSASTTQAYQALTTGYAHWWTKPDQVFKRVGDIARFSFPPLKSYWTFEAVKLVQNELVELKCVDAYHLHDDMPPDIETEWLGSILRFSIVELDGKTEITLDHLGLTPELLCYDVCEAGWDYFFLSSLPRFLNTGIGSPHGS